MLHNLNLIDSDIGDKIKYVGQSWIVGTPIVTNYINNTTHHKNFNKNS